MMSDVQVSSDLIMSEMARVTSSMTVFLGVTKNNTHNLIIIYFCFDFFYLMTITLKWEERALK